MNTGLAILSPSDIKLYDVATGKSVTLSTSAITLSELEFDMLDTNEVIARANVIVDLARANVRHEEDCYEIGDELHNFLFDLAMS